MGFKFLDLLEVWVENAEQEEDIIKELKEIEKNEEEVKDRFYKDLTFGTAGMRGLLGAGTNRMNIFVVGKITQAFCEFLKEEQKEEISVAISYDSRNKSDLFCKQTAGIFAANGIKVYIFEKLMPVPMLSFAVRNIKNCVAGVMITASHNPAEYNGYKIYGEDGCQLGEEKAEKIYEISTKINMFKDVKKINFNAAVKEGKICYIEKNINEKYYENVLNCLINKEVLKGKDFKVVYTPLNGAGREPVEEMFKRTGVKNYSIVKEQKEPDGNFKTCKYPNPETKEALSLGLRDCKEQKPDVLIATDPDCDRVGVAVPLTLEKDEYVVLNGNEIGVLMFNYICKQKTKLGLMPKNPVAIKTIVSSNLVLKIAEKYGVKVLNVLTGFKFIGEQIAILEKNKQEERFIFAFEESHGYLNAGYVRDKDGVFAAIFLCEIVAYYKKQNKSIIEVLEEIYGEYGYYLNNVASFTFKGQQGMKKMEQIMQDLREAKTEKLGEFDVEFCLDYLKGVKFNFKTKEENKLNFVRSNVLEYILKNGCSVIIRPSGTEPKIKIYYSVVGKTKKEAESLKEKLTKTFNLEEYSNS